MFNDKVKEIVKNSGYNFDYPITESHILSLMQQAYEAGKGYKLIKCNNCFGSGYVKRSTHHTDTCPNCHGSKTITVAV